MKKIILIFFFLFSILDAKVDVKTSTKTSTGEGVGLTREEAINNAIIEAVGKMNGVNINSIKKSETFAISDSDGGKIVDTYSQNINKATKGRADSYEILSVEQDGDRYIASVKIKKTSTTKSYQIPGIKADTRRSVVIFNSSDYEFRDVSDSLKQKLNTNLLETRKFNVLQRDKTGYYEVEKELLSSKDAHRDEIYKLGNVIGADYFLIFEITGAQTTTKKSNLTGVSKTKTQMSVDYQVILFATRQIKYSNTLVLDINLKDGSLAATNSALDGVANRIIKDITNVIYPLKISEISGDEVVFSQKLDPGEKYECFLLGQAVKDSYTGETAGRVETRAGSVEISRVTPKISYAKIIDGKLSKGQICRPLASGDNGIGGEGRDANYEINQNLGGGVKLGF